MGIKNKKASQKNDAYQIYKNIREELLKNCRPDTTMIAQINQTLLAWNKKLPYILKHSPYKNIDRCEFALGGSMAKGTQLAGKHDADIFCRFSAANQAIPYSDALAYILRQLNLRAERVHGSRDYFTGTLLVQKQKIQAEFVPVRWIKKPEEIQNVTDASLLHIAWFNKNATPEKKDDIRIAKLFFHAQRCYGAESYISGFSGHVLDILIVHYGSLWKLTQAMQDWKNPQVIDVCNYYSSSQEVLSTLNESKITSPLVVVDPIDKLRNASASVDHDCFVLAKKSAKKLLRSPSRSLFTYLPQTISEWEKNKGHPVVVHVDVFEGKTDVVGAAIKKYYAALEQHIIGEEFVVIKKTWEWDDKKAHEKIHSAAHLFFMLESDKRPKEHILRGPPIHAPQHHIDAFKLAHKNDKIIKEKGKYFAKIIRKETTITPVLKRIILTLNKKHKVQGRIALS